MQHGLKALAATLSEGELTKENVSISIVGKGAPYVVLEDDDVEPYVQVRSEAVFQVPWGRWPSIVMGLGVIGRHPNSWHKPVLQGPTVHTKTLKNQKRTFFL